MRTLILPLLLAITFGGAGLAQSAQAQVAYPGYGAAYGQPYGTYGAADRQRYEMERVRVQGQEAEAMARQQSTDTRLTLLELQSQNDAAVRRNAPIYAPYAPLRSVERERAARETATTQRETTVAGVSQIDRWLDRSPE